MFEALINGILLGFGVAVPFGPVNILILTYALKSFKNAFAIGLGAMSADIFYLILLNFGILKFLNEPFILKALAIFGFAFLTYMAFLMLKAKSEKLELREKSVNESVIKSYTKGLFLNFFNPYVIAFWLSVATLLASNDDVRNSVIMVGGLILAIFVWIFSLSFFVAKFSHKFSSKIIRLINVISAIIIEYFALALIYKNFF